jgi:hypothetical protein
MHILPPVNTMGAAAMPEFQPPQLGDRVKDPITGMTGIVVCISTWLHGCIRIAIQPEELKDGKPVEDRYFDQSQLVMMDRAVHKPMVLAVVPGPVPEERRSPGGPARETAGFRRA